MKILAKYLPQFHRTRENDAWWGEGFTEWTAVKKAAPLFEGHDQPRVPKDENYYDLLQKETMLWQASLMEKYGIDGMCIYHYWFKDGRQVLEKPAENLLRWKEVPMPFCFCWANETWARSWSKIQNKNHWSDIYEQKKSNGSSGILLDQKYGREPEWKAHFEYLLPFFRDERYIKVNHKPLFVIHKTSDIGCLPEMTEYFRELAKAYGLDGIYMIGSDCALSDNLYLDSELYRQPAEGMRNAPALYVHGYDSVTIREYDDIWKNILSQKAKHNVLLEGFTGYDDTPRRGAKGTVTVHATPEKFACYLSELMAKTEANGNDIVFLNAWNEWGEGMYMEPDELHGEAYLQAVLYAKKNYTDRVRKYKEEREKHTGIEEGKIDRQAGYPDKDTRSLHFFDKWMTLREEGFCVANWLNVNGYKRVAIYGYGIFGRHLCHELAANGIVITYVVDQNIDKLDIGYETFLPDDQLPETDIMIVTAIQDYGTIYKALSAKGIKKIISLKTMLDER